ncbi:MAG: hypothetical protein NVS1B4_18070 [Gemmatimonadaceae bacterium]
MDWGSDHLPDITHPVPLIGTRMRRLSLAFGLAVVLPSSASAQHRDSIAASRVPDIAQEATQRINAALALRLSGPVVIARDSVVRGDVALRDGRLTLGGHIAGRLTAINSDVILLPTAHIDGDLLVVGGAVRGADPGLGGGDIAVSAERVYTKLRGDSTIVERGLSDDQRWLGSVYSATTGSSAQFALGTFGTYSRVEGLPIYVGPALRYNADWGTGTLKAYAVIRTAGSGSSGDNRGHSVTSDVRFGRGPGFAIGGRLFDVVDPVEDWQLRDVEASLATFLLRRDYRDYFNRHGVSGRLAVAPSPQIELALSLSEERWRSRDSGDPWTLVRTGSTWRPNPQVDEGRMHVATATVRVDTRNDAVNPWSGWLATADYERGSGDLTPRGGGGLRLLSTLGGPTALSPLTYSRLFVDIRRYNRIAKNAQINLRAVFGSQLPGEDLPLQRRFAVGGPGTLPGFDFRGGANAASTFCPGSDPVAGNPASCQRVLLGQIEYRGDLKVSVFGSDDGSAVQRRAHRAFRYHSDAVWVLFADAGRGWLLGPAGPTAVRYGLDAIPALSTFRSDMGIGLDFDELGLYVTRPLNGDDARLHFLARVRHRF